MYNPLNIDAEVARLRQLAKQNETCEVYAQALSCVDLTTLTPRDTESSVRAFAERAVAFYDSYPTLQNVASICVYPPFVECVGMVVDGTPMRITSVAAGFPASQTYLEVKALEVAMAVESGADEVDVVISVGKILEGDYDEAAGELAMLRSEAGDEDFDHVILKVILETGELVDGEKIYDAASIAIGAGADFIKTSTCKSDISATPEAVYVMCQAIKDHYDATGEMVGIKVAGGVRSLEDVSLYYTIVREMLGEEWMTPQLFRIGASSVANSLLSAIVGESVKLF